jgi:hypothetical protein
MKLAMFSLQACSSSSWEQQQQQRQQQQQHWWIAQQREWQALHSMGFFTKLAIFTSDAGSSMGTVAFAETAYAGLLWLLQQRNLLWPSTVDTGVSKLEGAATRNAEHIKP